MYINGSMTQSENQACQLELLHGGRGGHIRVKVEGMRQENEKEREKKGYKAIDLLELKSTRETRVCTADELSHLWLVANHDNASVVTRHTLHTRNNRIDDSRLEQGE